MPYKITIEELTNTIETVDGEWTTVDTEEVERDARYAEKDGPRTRIKDVKGYAPSQEKRVLRTRIALVQEIDELNLIAVIRAINGIDATIYKPVDP